MKIKSVRDEDQGRTKMKIRSIQDEDQTDPSWRSRLSQDKDQDRIKVKIKLVRSENLDQSEVKIKIESRWRSSQSKMKIKIDLRWRSRSSWDEDQDRTDTKIKVNRLKINLQRTIPQKWAFKSRSFRRSISRSQVFESQNEKIDLRMPTNEGRLEAN